MDIHVTGSRAFALIRESRTGGTARLQPASLDLRGSGTGQMPPVDRLSAVAPRSLADISEERPLELVFPVKEGRRRSKLIRPHYDETSNTGSSCRVALSAEDLRSAGLPSELSILVDSPAQAFLNAAHTLSCLLGAGRIDHTSALLRLISLGCEFCGSYSRDPVRPRDADVTYRIAPACSTDEIREHLRRAGRAKGIALARKAASHLVDGLASPLECEFYYALVLKPRLGGASFPKPLVNKPLVDPGEEVESLRSVGATPAAHAFTHDCRITPDLQWPLSSLGIAVEVDGFAYHSGRRTIKTDRLRDQDYTRLGYQVIRVTRDNMASVEDLENILSLIVDKAARRIPRSRVGNLRRNINNPKASKQRETLLSVLG